MPTTEDRLRWVVEKFVRASLPQMSVGALERISDQLRDLYQTPITWRADGGAVGSQGIAVSTFADPIPLKKLKALQTTIREMVRRLVSGHDQVAIPTIPMFISRMTAVGRRHPRYNLSGQTDRERAAILVGFLELVLAVGDRLYACPACRQTFVAHLRQEYCSKPCSQKVRNAKRRPRKRDQGAGA